MPVRVADAQGWLKRLDLTEYVPSAVFCADPRPLKILDDLKQAVRQRDGDLLASLVHPKRGLDVSLYHRGHKYFSQPDVRSFFNDRSPYVWSAGDVYPRVEGSTAEIILPLLDSDLVQLDTNLACNLTQDVMTDDSRREQMEYDPVNYYSIQRPGATGHDLEWGTWLIGIDYWDGQPYLAYLSHMVWEP